MTVRLTDRGEILLEDTCPSEDAEILLGKGVASVYTPKDYSFDRIMEDLVSLAERQRAATPA